MVQPTPFCLTEHCRLRGHLRKVGLAKEDICRLWGEEEEISNHILLECNVVKCIGLLV